jgi:hypothetical protein
MRSLVGRCGMSEVCFETRTATPNDADPGSKRVIGRPAARCPQIGTSSRACWMRHLVAIFNRAEELPAVRESRDLIETLVDEAGSGAAAL